jgi:hypothetical protein
MKVRLLLYRLSLMPSRSCHNNTETDVGVKDIEPAEKFYSGTYCKIGLMILKKENLGFH